MLRPDTSLQPDEKRAGNGVTGPDTLPQGNVTAPPPRYAVWTPGDTPTVQESSTDDDAPGRSWSTARRGTKPPLQFSAVSQGWPSRKTALLLLVLLLLCVVALAVAVSAQSRVQQLQNDRDALTATVAELQRAISALQATHTPATIAVSPGVTVVGNSTFVLGESIFFGSPRTATVTFTGSGWLPSGVIRVNVGDNVTWINVSTGLVEVMVADNVTVVASGVNCTVAESVCSRQLLVPGLRWFRSAAFVMTVETSVASAVPGSLASVKSHIEDEFQSLSLSRAISCNTLTARVLQPFYLNGSSMKSRQWDGGVLASNGKIYGIPHESDRVLIIDPHSNSFDLISIIVGVGASKWAGGVLADNGKIYGVPVSANAVLVIDTATNAVDTTSVTWTGLTGQNLWYGGVLDPSVRKIFSVPFSASSVLIIDPATNITDTNSIKGLDNDFGKWVGGVLAGNGLIYCVPYAAKCVLIINPRTNVSDTTTIVDTGAGWVFGAWALGVLANNGKIFASPHFSAAVLIIDPATNTTDSVTLGDLSVIAPSTPRWTGATMGADGNIYMFPRMANVTLVINPTTNKLHQLPMTGNYAAAGTDKWWGGVKASDGRMYGIPYDGDSVLVIQNENCASGV